MLNYIFNTKKVILMFFFQIKMRLLLPLFKKHDLFATQVDPSINYQTSISLTSLKINLDIPTATGRKVFSWTKLELVL